MLPYFVTVPRYSIVLPFYAMLCLVIYLPYLVTLFYAIYLFTFLSYCTMLKYLVTFLCYPNLLYSHVRILLIFKEYNFTFLFAVFSIVFLTLCASFQLKHYLRAAGQRTAGWCTAAPFQIFLQYLCSYLLLL